MRWLVGVLSGLMLVACTASSPPPPTRSYAVPTPRAIVVGDVAPTYERDKDFGAGWDVVRGQCDTREVKIEEQSGASAVDKDGDGCKDDAVIIDPYCGLIIYPHCAGRPVSGRDLQADHVFSEHAAWLAGAWKWTFSERRAFSQDRSNLIMTFGPQNESKGDKGPDQWRPPSRDEWCQYARTYRITASRYLFPITASQDVALSDMESTCHGG